MEAVSVLSLLPLSVLDTNITCEVVVAATVHSNYVQASPAVMANGFLTIQCEFLAIGGRNTPPPQFVRHAA